MNAYEQYEKEQLEEKYGSPVEGSAGMMRTKLTEHECVFCKTKSIENVYVIVYNEPLVIGPGGRGHWSFSKSRCRTCGLVYSF